ncbi:porin [Burkholderia latens]|uniref:Membrane protein n=1 Tax=Burkholderia latens TaxID=488446 RepID=A0A6H9TM15_9BURK|nr:porin [Burkholderia latens]KAB0644826.1 porin [Burkholderia latens]VWB16577.1 membrane protein [Burkholderia latens]
MKKTLFAIAAIGVFSSVAHAQSSVTLYGVIDEGLSYTSNVATLDANGSVKRSHVIALQSGVLQGSRWGLKGKEDLGGGLNAVFQLENGFNASNGALGQGGRMFGRQAYVGLSSENAGTLTLGRQYDSVVDYLGPLTANGSWGGAFFSHPFDNDNTNNSFRINNSVKYTSANYGGLQFGGMYGFSNSTQFAKNRAWSLGARYANGPLTVAAAYLDLKSAETTNVGAETDGTPFTDLLSGVATAAAGRPVNVAFQKQRTGGIGASYAFGPATAGVMVSESLMQNPMSHFRFLNAEGNVQYSVTPALSLGAMYDYTRMTAGVNGFRAGGNFHTIGLMSDYFLSKRTDVYAQAVYQRGSESTRGLVGVVDAGGYSSGKSQVAARVGLRHKF